MSRYRQRWPLLAALVAGVAILATLLLLRSNSSSDAEPRRGGVYVEGVAGAPSRINPLFAAFNDVDRDLTSLIFSGLVRLGPKGDVQPDLAGLPKVTPDGLTYVFELEPDIAWQDGKPIDSQDVLFTIQAIQDPAFQGDPVLADVFRDVRVEARDPRTVTMTLPQPFSPFLARLASVGILPQHLLGDLDAAGLFEAPYNHQPVGSGPFELTSLTAAGAVLVPFRAYHLGTPLLERLELRFYRDDAELLNAVDNGDVDGALFRPGLERDDLDALDSDERWVRRTLHPTTYGVVYLNPLLSFLADRAVRQALQLGLDRPTLIDTALAGQALPLDSPIARDLWSYVSAPGDYSFDPQRAASLLEATGWALQDGVWTKGGQTLEFVLSASDDPLQVTVAQELARQWSELGVHVTVATSGAGQFVENLLLPRRFQAALVTVDPGPDPDPYPLWHTSQAFGTGRNLAGWTNAEADRLMEDARQDSSPADRAAAYRAFQQIFARELPAVLLYTPTYQYFVRSNVWGLGPGLLIDSSARFRDVQRWWVQD